jgi:hypothetical protein
MTSSKPPLKPCGTNAAYARHRKRGEDPCGPCTKAHDAETGDKARAHARAKSRLAGMYPATFRKLYIEELGYEPPKPGRPRKDVEGGSSTHEGSSVGMGAT